MIETTLRVETGSGPDGIRVDIIDEKSGMSLATFKLDPGQVFDFVRGSSVEIQGQLIDSLDRVGKTMVVETVSYNRDQLTGVDYGAQESYAASLAREAYPGWETYSGRRTGGGYGGVKVVMRKWVD